MKLKNPSAVCIGFTTEAIYPDLNIFDYAICFDNSYVFSDRVAIIPILDSFYNPQISLLSNFRESSKDMLKQKKRFCSFIYSNPDAHPRRDELFYCLNKYSKVDSLGKHLNNFKIENTRENVNWFDISIKLKSEYKFSIAAENGRFQGYTTEKLCSSYLAYSIPIYWGNNLIEEIVNPKAIINANNLSNQELLARIKDIDENDDLWCDIVSQPLFTQEQAMAHEKELKQYVEWFANIFSQDLSDAKRVSMSPAVKKYIVQLGS